MRFLGYKALTAFVNGHQPGPDASIGKMLWSHYHQEVTELAIDILGADALTPEGRGPLGAFRYDAVGSAPPTRPAGSACSRTPAPAPSTPASSQVQKGIVGEQILGLPKEPRADSGPWNQIPGHA